jgi:hypothetical protein
MTMRTVVLGLLVMLSTAHTVLAQGATPQRPTRPYRGLFGGGPPADPNRNRHELTLNASLQGGYDDVIAPNGGGGPVEPGVETQSGYAAFAAADLRYTYGRPAGRMLSVEGSTFTNSYATLNVDPIIGGAARVGLRTMVGRRSSLSASQDLRYEPTLVLGAFGPLEGAVDPVLLPEAHGQSGYAEEASWSTASGIEADQQWTRRQRSSAGASYTKRTYEGDLGFDSETTAASFQHELSPTRTFSVQSRYGYSHNVLFSRLERTPLTDHSFSGGATYARRLSPTRQIQFSGGLGATFAQTLTPDRRPLDYWTPNGYGSARVDLGRSWVVTGDYRRAVSVLQGISLQSFATNAVHVSVEGALSRRLDASFSTAYADGRSSAGDVPSRFDSYGATASLRYAFARCCAALVNYEYYLYGLQDVTGLPSGVPAEHDRNSVRVGIALRLPLYGAYSDSGGAAQTPRRR